MLTGLRKPTWWKPRRRLVAAQHSKVVFCASVAPQVRQRGVFRQQLRFLIVFCSVFWAFLFVYPFLCLREEADELAESPNSSVLCSGVLAGNRPSMFLLAVEELGEVSVEMS